MSIAFRTLCVVAVLTLVGCQQSSTETSTSSSSSSTASNAEPATPPATTSTSETAAPAAGEVTMPNGLKYQDLKVGDGAIAESGKSVSVHYTGTFTNGTKFDSSLDRGQPFQFQLGAGEVIRGWDEGIKGMRVGGKRKLTIPPDLAYGPNGRPGIPPNSTLLFDVELVEVH